MKNLNILSKNKIKLLESSVIDQIAAGEVVERPAHLVKELIENSLDAGSDKIEISLWNGWQNISVKDNGMGMNAEDLSCCLLRHATSKIIEIEDLWRLSSFGFRGEALSSISSVSDLTIKSVSKETKQPIQLKCSYGKLSAIEETKIDIGTEVIVENLFSNVPARLKFLKTEGAEVSAIKQTVKAMALCHPQVEFSFKIDNSIVLFYQGSQSLFERNVDIFSEKISKESLFYTVSEQDGLKLQIVYSSPKETVKSSKSIWIFVKNRWIQDRMVSSAFLEAYKNLLMHHEYPLGAIYLEMPADLVDINVHPAKSQIKFINSSEVYRFILKTLRGDLEKSRWLKSDAYESSAVKSYFYTHQDVENAFQLADKNQDTHSRIVKQPIQISVERYAQNQFQSKASYQNYTTLNVKENNSNSTDLKNEQALNYWSNLQVLTQLNLTYIVAQNKDKFILIDQHAAHERVNFERLMKSYRANCFETQNLLIPTNIDVNSEESEFLEANLTNLFKLGIDIEKTGPNLWCLKSHPSFLKESAVVQSVMTLLDNHKNKPSTFFIEKYITDTFASMACHSSVRAGQALSVEQMIELLVTMDQYPLSSFCPHGRPVSVEWSWYEIEKQFGRIV